LLLQFILLVVIKTFRVSAVVLSLLLLVIETDYSWLIRIVAWYR